MCVRHHVLVYHYCLAIRSCERFARFVNSPHYMFAMVDITNDVKALESSGIACQNLVDIQGQYKIWGSKEHEKDSLVHFAEAIIDPYYRNMKDSCNKDKRAWHSPGWRNSTKLTSCTRPRRRKRATTCTGGSLT